MRLARRIQVEGAAWAALATAGLMILNQVALDTRISVGNPLDALMGVAIVLTVWLVSWIPCMSLVERRYRRKMVTGEDGRSPEI
ncbi:MAG: hypothetical protein LBJ02_11520 [Bifidobacteriaceae bacterium]|jgi:hypothetical protein|nr:hypothetical protein [Bifidobacteriaceae bacterium]